ncbi:MAG: UDP-N-acetylmuramoyl-L-alanyl-D-glutamate--2,6-diaminopimelate ligase [Methylibium sp.]|uniref:Mur ligase family protein n=1 Tax=Methylibium sp. TaxID=2067992 RepID=UPI00181684B7|nr:UDP-N-acetylmuramoyl-L-alanyl-D-glutamate--2,6-diaminopimelate ligase [Methylibium sp.]MBA3598494.1 UDP-N-acetylmuramoyl-L-alanyl-D-glutamate--2,6-diaminopimelate ligase [Methylibium sp.]
MLTELASPQAAASWLHAGTRGRLRTDSREVRHGDAFIAWPGHVTDGRRFVGDALAAGAALCLVEAEGVEAHGFDDARIGALASLKAATGPIADLFYAQPSRALQMLAVTGTNGKTSTAWWIAQALSLLGRRCAVVGTLGIGQPPGGSTAHGEPSHGGAASMDSPGPAAPARLQATGLTTPDPVVLQAALRRMVDEGYAACAIEASSIGLDEHRLAGAKLDVALFTNLTRDHLDYHGSMEAYWAAKRRLFSWPGLAAAVVNVDDEHGAALAGELKGGALELWTYSTRAAHAGAARLHASDIDHASDGLAFTVHEAGEAAAVRSTLIGDYNVANLLAVIGGLRALGISLNEAASVVSELTPVPGRLQRVMMARAPDAATAPGAGSECLPEVVVDYAHTPDALEKALTALRPLAQVRGGRLLCVFGCGGNRDASKRAPMGTIAERLADAVVLTSDNPRFEAPAAILAQIAAGLQRPAAASVIEDRRSAIAQVIAGAAPRDLVLIAGKGHEDYQETGGVRQPFSDVAEAELALLRRSRA